VEVDLSKIDPSIALPYHPSEVYTIKEVLKNPHDIFAQVEERSKTLFENNDVVVDMQSKIIDGKVKTDQGIIVGCSGGTFDNLLAASQIVKGKSAAANGYSFSCYAGSQPIYLDLLKKGAIADLVEAGAIIKPSFCGPCFGAGDTPGNNEFSIRHATRNFPNREGSKPGEGQISMVALMDARSIAATAINGGFLTSAEDVDWENRPVPFVFDKGIYDRTVVNCLGKADPKTELVYGPNIKPWPNMPALTDDLLLVVSSHIDDPVTTTDELIPSGETSSYRSNPLRLAEFTLSRKDPAYVAHAKNVQTYEVKREKGNAEYYAPWLKEKLEALKADPIEKIGIGSAIFANSPGDGSAREQAASNQKVLGGWANFAKEYATKRYRSNLINWGILPFLVKDGELLPKDAIVFVPNIRKAILDKKDEIHAYVLFENEEPKDITLKLGGLTDNEREILLAGCLINFNRNNAK
jgi:aconitate hydratase